MTHKDPPLTTTNKLTTTQQHTYIDTSIMPSSPWLKKPLWVLQEQERQHPTHRLERHLSLFDLWSLGVGGTIGSGIFVLTGYIAHQYAGPATVISFAISGLAAACSGMAYAELAGRLPIAGSTYLYAYVAMGELPAVLAAACLTLEYAVSGAAVARSWGDKVVLWLQKQWNIPHSDLAPYLDPGYGVNPMAFFISILIVALLLGGVKEAKRMSNIMTTLKVFLVLFMILGGFYYGTTDHWTPFIPFGTPGIMRGATSSFFAYLGYDEVCCLAGEARYPQHDMPRAVLLIVATVAFLSMASALALTSLQPSTEIQDTSAFPAAFQSLGLTWAAQGTAAGEVITLPVVILISLLAQPRLQQALAKDGLLPQLFARVNAKGNLNAGIWVSGTLMTLLATFVPFGQLDDLISAGILLAFSMTNTCLVLLRCESPSSQPNILSKWLLCYNILCFLTTMMLSSHVQSMSLAILFGLATLCTATLIWYKFPSSISFGFGGSMNQAPQQQQQQQQQEDMDMIFFTMPLVPLLPCLGTFVNWYLISQLEMAGLLLLLLYLGLATAFYLSFGAKHSVGNTCGWKRNESLEGLVVINELEMKVEEVNPVMGRSISMTRVGGRSPTNNLRDTPIRDLEELT